MQEFNIYHFLKITIIYGFVFLIILILKNLYSNYYKKGEKIINDLNDIKTLKKFYIKSTVILYTIFFLFSYFSINIKFILENVLKINVYEKNIYIIFFYQFLLFIYILIYIIRNIIKNTEPYRENSYIKYFQIEQTFYKNNLIPGIGFVILLILIYIVIYIFLKNLVKNNIKFIFFNKNMIYCFLTFLYLSFFDEFFYRYYIIHIQKMYYNKKYKYKLDNYSFKNIRKFSSIYSASYFIFYFNYLIKNTITLNIVFIAYLSLFSIFMYWYKEKVKSVIYLFLFHFLSFFLGFFLFFPLIEYLF